MALEPETLLRFLLFFFAAQMLILWLLLPFAIYGIKKRLGSMLGQNRQLYSEICRLRQTLETIPGATRVGRRLVSAEEQKFQAEEGEELPDETSAASERSEPKVDSPAPRKREGAASLIEDENLPEEGDEEYGPVEPAVAAKPKKKDSKKKKKPALPPPEEDAEDSAEEAEEEEASKKAAKKQEAAKGKDTRGEDDDTQKAAAEKADEEEDFVDDSVDYEDDSVDEIPDDEELHAKLVDLPMKSKERKQVSDLPDGIIVDIPPEDEISEDEEGFFVYRGEKYEHLIDAMRQQQIDAQAERAEKTKKTG